MPIGIHHLGATGKGCRSYSAEREALARRQQDNVWLRPVRPLAEVRQLYTRFAWIPLACPTPRGGPSALQTICWPVRPLAEVRQLYKRFVWISKACPTPRGGPSALHTIRMDSSGLSDPSRRSVSSTNDSCAAGGAAGEDPCRPTEIRLTEQPRQKRATSAQGRPSPRGPTRQSGWLYQGQPPTHIPCARATGPTRDGVARSGAQLRRGLQGKTPETKPPDGQNAATQRQRPQDRRYTLVRMRYPRTGGLRPTERGRRGYAGPKPDQA